MILSNSEELRGALPDSFVIANGVGGDAHLLGDFGHGQLAHVGMINLGPNSRVDRNFAVALASCWSGAFAAPGFLLPGSSTSLVGLVRQGARNADHPLTSSAGVGTRRRGRLTAPRP